MIELVNKKQKNRTAVVTLMARNLRILAWNANGLLQRQQELQLTLETQKIDICLISETHFTDQIYIRFKGYQVYCASHPQNSARGGVAVIVKNDIIHYEREKFETNEIQAASVSIKTKKYEITVAAIYSPPRYKIQKDEYMRFFRGLGEKFILGGDFNAKNAHWGSRLTTTKGKELYNAIIQINGKWHSTGKPTYWPTDRNKIPDLLDFFISRQIAINCIKVEEGDGPTSDHSPILCTLSETVITKQPNPVLTNKGTDWESFQMELNERIELNVPIKTIEQLELEVQKFMTDIQKSAWNNTPEIKRKRIGYNYPQIICNMVKEKRKARKQWQKSRTRENKNKLNYLAQQLKKEIQKFKNESMENYLSELTDEKNTEYSLWKATKRFNRPSRQTPPLREENGTWARNNQQKVDAFAVYLEKVFQPNEELEITEEPEIFQSSQEIDFVTTKEVAKEIKENLNSKKAPGFDLITAEILKKLPRKGISKITQLINAIFRLKYVPVLWKTAEVIMIPKPGKPINEVKSYRPISLLPVISKLFEKLFLRRIKKIIEEKQVVPTHQFGFRNKHSTVDQVHLITDVIEKCLKEKIICSAIFLDVAQSFDKVWHEGLITKFKKCLPEQYVNLVQSYLTQRTFRVREENEYSELKIVSAGVPQGSVLGPVLYLLYTCDIPIVENIKLATFADDTAVLAIEETTTNLQGAVDSINTSTKRWRIRINEGKSAHVNFTNRKIRYYPIVLNNVTIPHKKQPNIWA